MGDGPIRTCTGCRARREQRDLMRVSRHSDGTVTVDPDRSGRSPGRGAYLCRDAACVRDALHSGRLRRALRLEGELPEDVRAQLMGAVETGRERDEDG